MMMIHDLVAGRWSAGRSSAGLLVAGLLIPIDVSAPVLILMNSIERLSSRARPPPPLCTLAEGVLC